MRFDLGADLVKRLSKLASVSSNGRESLGQQVVTREHFRCSSDSPTPCDTNVGTTRSDDHKKQHGEQADCDSGKASA